MQEQIERDLKDALLSGDKPKAETLRGLKSAILNEAIALGVKDQGLSDEQIQKVMSREAKKRTEAIELYEKAGEAERAASEKAEKEIIEAYLPAQASPEEVAKVVDEEIAKLDSPTMGDMGKIIGAVKSKLPTADGAAVASLVKEKLS